MRHFGEEKQLCSREARQGLTQLLSEIAKSSGLNIELRYAGEGEGTFWVEFLAVMGVVVGFADGIGNACQMLGVALEKWRGRFDPPVIPLQETGNWFQGVAWRLVARPPQGPGAPHLRPGRFGKEEWLDVRTTRCQLCGFLGDCKQRVKGIT